MAERAPATVFFADFAAERGGNFSGGLTDDCTEDRVADFAADLVDAFAADFTGEFAAVRAVNFGVD